MRGGVVSDRTVVIQDVAWRAKQNKKEKGKLKLYIHSYESKHATVTLEQLTLPAHLAIYADQPKANLYAYFANPTILRKPTLDFNQNQPTAHVITSTPQHHTIIR